MKKRHMFGFLSTITDPLLPFWIDGAHQSGIENIVVICDSMLLDEKESGIWEERTGSAFEKIDNGGLNIYSPIFLHTPFYFVENHNSVSLLRLVEKLDLTCLFNAGTPRQLSQRILSSVSNGVVNVHPGLLPKYRGCTAVEWALYNGDKVGNTAHFMDRGYVTGPIITSECYEFPPGADYKTIRSMVYKNGCVLAGKVLSMIQDDDLKPVDASSQDPNEGECRRPIPEEKMSAMLAEIQRKATLIKEDECHE